MGNQKSKLEKNQVVSAVVTGLTHDGYGVCKVDENVVFVPFTALNDEVEIIILKVGKSVSYAKLERIIKSSPDRITASCPAFTRCGGCDFSHMSYESECRVKTESMRRTLQKMVRDIEVLDIIPADSTNGYRNKAQIPFAMQKNEVVSGFYRSHSHDVVAVDNCHICSDSANMAARILRKFATDYQISIYDEKSHKGLLRSLFVRTGDSGALVVSVCNGRKLPNVDKLVERLQVGLKDFAGLMLNVNTKATNVVLGEEFVPIWGEFSLKDSLLNIQYEISPASFYQINKAQCEKLYSEVIRLAKLSGDERVLDMYCGIGTITLSLAKHCKEVVGVEVSQSAVENANANATLNGINNARFICAAAEKITFDDVGGDYDVAVLDPPRKGCDINSIELLCEIAPDKIIYVSCNGATLARDLAEFSKRGYEIGVAQPLDMFPRTYHTECIVALTKRK